MVSISNLVDNCLFPLWFSELWTVVGRDTNQYTNTWLVSLALWLLLYLGRVSFYALAFALPRRLRYVNKSNKYRSSYVAT